VKKAVIITAGIVFLLLLSASATITETTRITDSEANAPVTLNEPPGLPHISDCRFSGAFSAKNGNCLVFRLGLQTIRLPSDEVSLMLDFYLYDTIISKELSLSKRLNINLGRS